MKKILTLAIALVMVFAIAAPAFASGWDIDPEPAKEIKDITLAIDALSLEKDATAGWNDGASGCGRYMEVPSGAFGFFQGPRSKKTSGVQCSDGSGGSGGNL